MVLNSFFAWNMSVAEVGGRLKVKTSGFYAVLAEEMIAFVDNVRGDDIDGHTNIPMVDPLDGHAPLPINHRECMQCVVCKLEENWIDNAGIPKEFGAGS